MADRPIPIRRPDPDVDVADLQPVWSPDDYADLARALSQAEAVRGRPARPDERGEHR